MKEEVRFPSYVQERGPPALLQCLSVGGTPATVVQRNVRPVVVPPRLSMGIRCSPNPSERLQLGRMLVQRAPNRAPLRISGH